MKMHDERADDPVWIAIGKERRRDRLLRSVGAIAWIVTLALVIVYGAMVASEVSRLRAAVAIGVAQPLEVFRATIPLIAVVGTVTLLIATLSTIGIFLRMRTATLTEIQLRLAALEAMLSSRPDRET